MGNNTPPTPSQPPQPGQYYPPQPGQMPPGQQPPYGQPYQNQPQYPNYQQPKRKRHWYGRWYMIVLYVIIFLIVIGSLGSSSEKAKQVPLEVKNPKDGFTTTEKTVKVDGVSMAGAIVSINGEDVTCDGSGNFSKDITLNSTENTITLEARAEGKTSNKQAIKVTKKLTLAEFKAAAKEIPYGQLEKNPDDYKDEMVHYRGEIFTIKEESGKTTIQMNVTDKGYGFWDDQIMVTYDGTTPYVKDDVVNVYGTIVGREDYKSVANYNMSVPLVKAAYVEK